MSEIDWDAVRAAVSQSYDGLMPIGTYTIEQIIMGEVEAQLSAREEMCEREYFRQYYPTGHPEADSRTDLMEASCRLCAKPMKDHECPPYGDAKLAKVIALLRDEVWQKALQRPCPDEQHDDRYCQYCDWHEDGMGVLALSILREIGEDV